MNTNRSKDQITWSTYEPWDSTSFDLLVRDAKGIDVPRLVYRGGPVECSQRGHSTLDCLPVERLALDTGSIAAVVRVVATNQWCRLRDGKWLVKSDSVPAEKQTVESDTVACVEFAFVENGLFGREVDPMVSRQVHLVDA